MITVISGTNRNGAKSLALARHITQLHADAGEETRLLDLAQLPLEALAPTAYDEKPPALHDGFIEPVLAAQGLVVVTPEYNGGFPGALKLLIDLLPFPEAFEDRPVCFVGISAGASGAVRPVEQLQGVFGYRYAYIYPRRVFLPAVYKLVNEAGEITDEEIAGRLEKQASGFRQFIQQVKGV